MTDTDKKQREEELEKKLGQIRIKGEENRYIELAQKLGLPFSDLKSAPIDPGALALIKEAEARAANIAIIYKKGSQLVAATTDPESPAAKKIIKQLVSDGYTVDVIITDPRSFSSVLQRYSMVREQEVFEMGAIEINEKELEKLQGQVRSLSDLKTQVSQVSTTKLLEILLAGALKIQASDIHFEPEADSVRLRYRLDGVLNDIVVIDKGVYQKALNRIKVLSKVKLNVHKVPQDGRFTIHLQDVDIEVRVSILPSEFGETIVMRLLDPRTIKKDLGDLGIREDLLVSIKNMLDKPTGAILTTGPTGSGKTTTLYAFVNHLNSPGTKIITIEDPIEYHIKGISQTQVDSGKGYTFANGLRAIVRQDPDIILVGEIRDKETADIALQASLTGHLVLSTIHTNDSAGTIPRLVDFGIQPQTIAPAINMAMAQRLVRKLCPACKIVQKPGAADLKKVEGALSDLRAKYHLPELKTVKIGYPGKCAECNDTGYKGRIGIYEAFIISKDMERLILKSPAISDVRDLAIKEGMVTMLQDAYMKLLDGITSIEEIERIVG